MSKTTQQLDAIAVIMESCRSLLDQAMSDLVQKRIRQGLPIEDDIKDAYALMNVELDRVDEELAKAREKAT